MFPSFTVYLECNLLRIISTENRKAIGQWPWNSSLNSIHGHDGTLWRTLVPHDFYDITVCILRGFTGITPSIPPTRHNLYISVRRATRDERRTPLILTEFFSIFTIVFFRFPYQLRLLDSTGLWLLLNLDFNSFNSLFIFCHLTNRKCPEQNYHRVDRLLFIAACLDLRVPFYPGCSSVGRVK